MKISPNLYERRRINTSIGFSNGFIIITSEEPLSDQNILLLNRFTKVFEQTYTRFLDLQKAEAQARESEIELALERVRARTMAMQHSDELTEASEVLDQQVRALGIETWGCAFHIYADDPEGDYEWFSNRDGSLPFYKTPREKIFLKYFEKGKEGENLYVEEFLGEDCKAHYDYLMTIPVMGDALRAVVATGVSLPDSQYDHVTFFKHGFLLFITYQPVPESHDIFKRFTKVFEQTYTRFLDLQKAEAQAREAQIEAALEKVRSRSLAMHKAEELKEVASVLRNEMGLLGVEELETSSIYILDDTGANAQCWYAIKDVRTNHGKLATDHMTLNLNETEVGRSMLSFYRSGEKQTSIMMKGENRKEWINYCATKSSLLEGYYGGEIPERTYHLLKFSNGYMGASVTWCNFS
ncbi:MAG: hypothetical protein U5K54_04255 [Cytophagales bacterium]|nr:hypothetical protein [Cytophagales bacterium]